MTDIDQFLHQLCDAAAIETLARFRTGLDVANKLDTGFDPVTEGDREAERVIRQMIGEHFPDHGIIGEEMGTSNSGADYTWVIDPIDGTRAFITGIPVWGTLIALVHKGEAIAGIMHQPYTGERYWAAEGKAFASRDGDNQIKRLQTRATENLNNALMMTTSPRIFAESEQAAYDRVEQQVQLVRYGCDCYAYAMLAAGNIDLIVESGLNTYDVAALVPIVENAGGRMTSWNGETAVHGGQIIAAANEALHNQAMELLAKG